MLPGMDEVRKENIRLRRAFMRRRKVIIELRAKGWTMQRIGDRFGLSRQRVQQILGGR